MENNQQEKKNPYRDEVKKFIKKQVIVKDQNGNKYEGECRAINFQHLNVVLMDEDDKTIVRNIQYIKRKREKGDRK
jgi:small nuclear ribonucleoprotein (snRNP)-like protein